MVRQMIGSENAPECSFEKNGKLVYVWESMSEHVEPRSLRLKQL